MTKTAPSHVGWFGFVPVWLWLDGGDLVIHPRYLLPNWLLDFVSLMQATACGVLGDEPHFRVSVSRTTTEKERGRRGWQS